MTGLEIALFVLGAAFIIISFFIVDNVSGSSRGVSDRTLAGDTLRRISADAIEEMNHRSDLILADSEEKLESISNDKIIAVGEYSDQILEKINGNHKEVVFLYQMLSDKEEALKDTASRLENLRIECEKLIKNEVALEVQRSNDTALPHISSELARQTVAEQRNVKMQEVDLQDIGEPAAMSPVKGQETANVQTEQKRTAAAQKTPASPVKAPAAKASPAVKAPTASSAVSAGNATAKASGTATAKTGGTTAAKTAGNAAAGTGTTQTKTVRKAPQPQARISIEAEGRDNASLSRNEEIISLHRQGKSVMEISKLLAMGQGEVRLIINLYG